MHSCLVIQNAVYISLSLALFKLNFINWNHPLSKIGRHPDLDKAKLCIPLTELSSLILNVPALTVLSPHQQLCMNVLWEETAGWSVSFWQILSMVQCQPGETQQMAFHRGYFVGQQHFNQWLGYWNKNMLRMSVMDTNVHDGNRPSSWTAIYLITLLWLGEPVGDFIYKEMEIPTVLTFVTDIEQFVLRQANFSY